MYDPTKIIFGFDDLAIFPQTRATDRKVKADIDLVKQKCGKSRFLISLRDQQDAFRAIKDKSNYYIADIDDTAIKISMLLDTAFNNVIPVFGVKEFLKEKKFISSELCEGKDKFNIIVNVGEDIGSLFDLRSVENIEFLKLFRVIYRVYSNSQIIEMLVNLNANGIIVDKSFEILSTKTKATNISDTAGTIFSILGEPKRYPDLFEPSKDRILRVLSDYDEKDPYCIKSFALGAQFVIIDGETIEDANKKINSCEAAIMHIMDAFNCGSFEELYKSMICTLVSKN